MNFIGVDLSFTGTGLVVLSESLEILCQKLITSSPKEPTEQRIVSISEQVFSEIRKYPPCIICIEGLSFSSRGQATLDLAGLHYFIRISCMVSRTNRFYAIPPTTLKKFVTGTGRCQKNLMLLKTYKKFGVEFSDDNLCDAYCLAQYAKNNYGSKIEDKK